MLNRIKHIYSDYKHKRTIKNVRSILTRFGVETDHINDNELVARIISAMGGLSGTSVSVKQAVEALENMGRLGRHG